MNKINAYLVIVTFVFLAVFVQNGKLLKCLIFHIVIDCLTSKSFLETC